MAHPLTPLHLTSRWSPVAYVVVLGAAVATARLLPWLGVVCSLLAMVMAWAWPGGVPRRGALLASAPLVLTAGVPWPVPALAASALFRLVEVRVAGAAVLGVVLGVLRLRPAGLPGCVAVHAAVDVAIFGLVAERVVWVG